MKKKIVIIGAGVAGMAAGIYAQLNGFQSEIYEQHTVQGGECTSWYRKGYTVDGAISWLTGTKENTIIHKVWTEVGAFEDKDIVYSDVFSVIEMDGVYLYWYRDVERLEKHLCEISKEDKEEIGKLTEIIRNLMQFEIASDKPIDLMNVQEKKDLIHNYMKVFQTMGSICSMTTEAYVKRFRSKLIQNAILSFAFRDNLVQGVFITLGAIAGKQAGWIKGGSRRLTDNMKQRYLDLGGKIFCNQKVEEIIMENYTAIGIKLEDGRFVYGDYVIPACDIYVTMKKLLQDRYFDEVFEQFYTNPGYRVSSIAQVTIGVDCDLSVYPEKMIHIIKEKEIAGEKITSCLFTHYCTESRFAPEGKSVIKTGLTIYEPEHWFHLNESDYEKKKVEIKEAYLQMLYKYYPETQGKVEMVDVTTPLTYERYCGAYRGAYMAFMLTKETNKITHSGVIKGVNHLFIAGQWLNALGGLPDAVVSGKSAIQRICKQEGSLFKGA